MRTTVLATDRARPEDEAGQRRPAQCPGQSGAHQGGDGDLADGTGDRDARNRKQVLQREVQAHAEHQQDDADLSQFGGQGRVGREARCVGTDHDAGEQVSDKRLNAQPLRDQTEDESEHQTRSNRSNERGMLLRHPVFLSASDGTQSDVAFIGGNCNLYEADWEVLR